MLDFLKHSCHFLCVVILIEVARFLLSGIFISAITGRVSALREEAGASISATTNSAFLFGLKLIETPMFNPRCCTPVFLLKSHFQKDVINKNKYLVESIKWTLLCKPTTTVINKNKYLVESIKWTLLCKPTTSIRTVINKNKYLVESIKWTLLCKPEAGEMT